MSINKHRRVRIKVNSHLVDTYIHAGPNRPFAGLIISVVLLDLHLFTKSEKKYFILKRL